MINPKLKPLVKLELEIMEKAKIFSSIRCSKWISNLVVVRKKNGTICLCIYFQDINYVEHTRHTERGGESVWGHF